MSCIYFHILYHDVAMMQTFSSSGDEPPSDPRLYTGPAKMGSYKINVQPFIFLIFNSIIISEVRLIVFISDHTDGFSIWFYSWTF